jgi:hypothetical protein
MRNTLPVFNCVSRADHSMSNAIRRRVCVVRADIGPNFRFKGTFASMHILRNMQRPQKASPPYDCASRLAVTREPCTRLTEQTQLLQADAGGIARNMKGDHRKLNQDYA